MGSGNDYSSTQKIRTIKTANDSKHNEKLADVSRLKERRISSAECQVEVDPANPVSGKSLKDETVDA